MLCIGKMFRGFTLVEVLITLAVIGVVAAIAMPMLITNVRNQVRAKRIENIEQKFSKATDKMVALGLMTGHGSTAEFVIELGKHLKLAKVCDNDNLQSCWPYEKVELSTGKMWKISKAKKAEDMEMKDDENSTWDDTMGIITSDGTGMILSYNTKCDIDDTKPITYPSKSSISSTTGCIAVKYDWNGATKPNKDGDDIIAINAGAFNNSCLYEIDDTCFTKIIKKYNPVDKVTCESMKSTHGIKWCDSDIDYWAGAVKQCGHVNNLPTMADLAKMAEEIYVISGTTNKASIGAYDRKSGLTFQTNSSIVKVLGLHIDDYLWSGEEVDSTHAWRRRFFADETYSYGGSHENRTAELLTVCKK